MNEEILPARLGWSNPETGGGANGRLYATDKNESPRWDDALGRGGRTIERALIERDGAVFEGDQYLIVRVGDRFKSRDDIEFLASEFTKILHGFETS